MAPPVPIRRTARRLPRDQRVAKIMEVARAVLRERGSEQFLTAEVAERCGISEGTIYKYFPTKRDLLIQVAEEWFEEFLTELRPSDRQLPIRDQLLNVVRKNLSIIRRERSLTRFVLMELRADPKYRQMRIHEQNRQIARGITDVIEDGVRTGALRGDVPVKMVRDMIYGAIEQQTWAYLRGEGEFSVEQSAVDITDVIMRGVGADNSAETDIGAAVGRLEHVAGALSARLDALREPKA
jgi:AcrR family transcriptional regulator